MLLYMDVNTNYWVYNLSNNTLAHNFLSDNLKFLIERVGTTYLISLAA